MTKVKVYLIDVDAIRFSPLCPVNDDDVKVLVFKGIPIKAWPKPKFFMFNPLRDPPDFWSIGGADTFAFDADRSPFNELPINAHLDDAGEWLEIDVEDVARPLSLLNVTTVANALDVARSRWRSFDAGSHKYVDPEPGSYVFHADRLPETSIFKIPQNNASEIFCWERTRDPRYEFKAAVEDEGLTGLKFNLIWEQE